MVVYTCMCLNVQVFGHKSSKQLEGEALNSCPFGCNGCLIELIDPGFDFVHKSLVHRKRNGPWTEYVCVPCHMRTHAVNVKANLLVVSKDLVVGEEAVEEIKKRPEYSRALGILVNTQGSGKKDTGVELQSHDLLQKQLVDLQSVIGLFLKEQEDAMERRIQKYEQEQRLIFDKLTDRAKKDKNDLVSILFHNSERSVHSAEAAKAQTKSHIALSHSKSADMHHQQHESRNVEISKSRRMRDSSPDVFAMEEFDIDADEDSGLGLSERSGNPVKYDQEESNPFTRGESRFGGHRDRFEDDIEEADDVPNMSTSVPISMPAKHFRNSNVNTRLDDDIEEAAEFSDIPRHIQQLSESIQERDRYIFGDRPRQRVHTGDFTQVKWNM